MTDVDWHNLPPLTTLRAFEATARLQGYSAAARSLNVTPAAIAQQVRKLETEVGAALVRREGRGLVLTDAGQKLALPLHQAFEIMVKGIEDLQLSQATRGVRVSTTDFFVNVVILPSLGEFWKQHPTLQLSFSPDGNTQPVDLDNFEIVIRGGPKGHSWEGCQQNPLIETPMIIYAAPDLIGSGNIDFLSLPWIQDRSIGWALFQRMIEEVGCDFNAIQIVDPGNAKLEMDAAMMGYGLSIGPEALVRKQLSDGSLVKLYTSRDMVAVYYLICRKGPLARPVRLVRDWLVELCAPMSSKSDVP